MPAFRPNWCSSVMGTAIVAVVASSLTVHVPGAYEVAVGAWLVAAALFVGLGALALPAFAGGGLARFADNPHTAPFLGTIPMGAVTLAAATVDIGRDVIGVDVALAVAAVLWTFGAVAGAVCAFAVPLRAVHRPALRVDPGHPTWILPAVPPLAAATAGMVFVPHLPEGAGRTIFLAVCGVLLLLGVVGAVGAIRLVAHRTRRVGIGPLRSVPTLWIVLGPIGQTVAAVPLLAKAAGVAGPATTAIALGVWGVGVAVLLAVLATTLWAARTGLPFSLAWWSFTFPVGTLALGTEVLARRTGAPLLADLAVGLVALLLAGWTLAAAGTARYAWRLVLRPDSRATSIGPGPMDVPIAGSTARRA